MRARRIGAVLSDEDVERLCHQKKPLLADWDSAQLQGAKYDLRIADTGMVLPSGAVIKPDSKEPHQSLILLEPGQTIFVSTRERLCLPRDLVGNMSIKGNLSREGVLSLTGLIVDPGYDEGPSKDGRLHFRLANLGPRPVPLKPGETSIASIQFLPLAAPAKSCPPKSVDLWANPQELKEGLGFIEELRDLGTKVEGIRHDFEDQRRSVEYVVVAGILVILVTLLGVMITGLLSLGADSELIDSAKNVIPDDGRGQWLFVLGIFGFAAVFAALVLGVARGRRPPAPAPHGHRRVEKEAVRDLEILRTRRLCVAAGCASVLTVGSLAVAIDVIEVGVYGAVGVGLAIITLCLYAIFRAVWEPITQRKVDRKLAAWQADAP